MQKLLRSYKQMSVQVKAAIWFTLCSVLQKGISFITVPIFTRLLTSEEYGIYSLYISWLQILTIITSLYLYQGVFNNGMTKFDDDRDTYISSMQGLTLTITAGVFAVYLVGQKMWCELLALTPIYMILMFVEMAVTPALRFWSGKQRFEFRYKQLVALTLAKSIANPVLGLIMVWLAQEKALARVASVVITEVVFCGFIMVRQFTNGRCFYHRTYWKYALGLAIPLLPHYLSGMILSQGDRIMIAQMVGKPEVAFYSVAYSIGMLVHIFTDAIANSFTPWMYQKFKTNNHEGIKRNVNYMLLIVGTIAVGLMMASPEMVMLFGSKEYVKAAYVIPPVAASVYFIFLYHLFAVPQFYYEKTKFLPISSFVAAVVNVALNYFFIDLFGYMAAGYTTLMCYVLYGIGHYLASKRILRSFMDIRMLYDIKFIFTLSLTIIVISIGCNFLFDYWYIRYMLIAMIGIVVLIKKQEILDLLIGIRKK